MEDDLHLNIHPGNSEVNETLPWKGYFHDRPFSGAHEPFPKLVKYYKCKPKANYKGYSLPDQSQCRQRESLGPMLANHFFQVIIKHSNSF